MKRFSLKQVVIGVIAVAALWSQWPPYFLHPSPTDRTGFNEDIWAVAGLEAFIFVVVALTRKADSLRRELDDPPPQDAVGPTLPRSRRRWPRFSLRTLAVVVTVTCLSIAWVRHVVERRREMMNWIIANNGDVQYAWLAHRTWGKLLLPNRRERPWIYRALGDASIDLIALPSGKANEEDRKRFQAAFPEAQVVIGQ
jgi:hypothetical protein